MRYPYTYDKYVVLDMVYPHTYKICVLHLTAQQIRLELGLAWSFGPFAQYALLSMFITIFSHGWDPGTCSQAPGCQPRMTKDDQMFRYYKCWINRLWRFMRVYNTELLGRCWSSDHMKVEVNRMDGQEPVNRHSLV